MQTHSTNRTRSGPAIWYRVRADLRGRRVQTASVAVSVALATLLIGLGLVISGSASAPYDRLFAQLNGAHLWIYTLKPLTPGQLDAIVHAPGVVGATAQEETATRGGILVGTQTLGADIRSYPAQTPAIGKLAITAGQGLATDDPTGIVVDQAFADMHHLHPGSAVRLVTEQGIVAAHVRGVAIDANHDSSQDGRDAQVHLLRATLDQLFQQPEHRVGVIGLRVSAPNDVGAVLRTITQRLQAQGYPDPRLNLDWEDWQSLRADFGKATTLTVTVLLIFGAVSLIAAGIIVANLVIGQVLAQQRDLGILKAVGFTPLQVVRTLLLEYLLLGAAGGLIGLGLIALVAPWLLDQLTMTLAVPVPAQYPPLLMAALLAGLLTFIALCAVLPAWRASRTRIVDVIRPGGGAANARRSWLGGFLMRSGVPVVVALGVRGMTARPLRSLLIGVTLLVGIVAALFSLSATATLQRYETDPALNGVFADIFVAHDLYDPLAMQQLIASRPEIAYYYATFQQAAALPDGARTLAMLFTSGDPRRAAATLTTGRWFHGGADELVVSEGTLQDLNMRLGDQIPLVFTRDDGRQVTVPYTIVGTIYVTQRLDQAYAPLDSFVAQTGVSAATVADRTGYEVTLRPGISPQAFAQTLQDLTSDRIGVNLYTLNPPPGVAQGVSLVAYLSIGLLLIAGIGILNAMLLATRERYRELATLKAIGLTPRQMLRSVTDGALALGVLTLVIGIPLGLVLATAGLSVLIQQLGGLPSVQIGVNWLGVGLLVLVTLLVATLGAYLPARWAARVPVSEALRYE